MDISMLKECLGDELYARVQEKLEALEGMQVIAQNDGSWLPKGRLDAEIARRRELQASVKELQGKLQEQEGLRAQLKELAQAVNERERIIGSMRRSDRIRRALEQANVRDAGLVEKLLDAGAIREDAEGNLEGLQEQITLLRERSGYLFRDGVPEAQHAGFGGGRAPQSGGAGGAHRDVNSAIRAAAGRI